MSITNCPRCQTELDPTDDSIYCEECGWNITREFARADDNEAPKLTSADGVFLLPEQAEAILSQLEHDYRMDRIRPDLDESKLTDAYQALGASLRSLRAF